MSLVSIAENLLPQITIRTSCVETLWQLFRASADTNSSEREFFSSLLRHGTLKTFQTLFQIEEKNVKWCFDSGDTPWIGNHQNQRTNAAHSFNYRHSIMRVVLTFFLLASSVWASSDDEHQSDALVDCKTWPTNLRPLQECCYIPLHSNARAQIDCYAKCSSPKIESREECATDWYVNVTGLLKEGVLRKDVAKKLYENNSFGDSAWKKVIAEGVDKCEFETHNSTVIAELIKFYNCVNDHLTDNCANFIHSDECYSTEEYFEKCRNIQPNCNEWPAGYPHPEACCKTPQLISEALRMKCRLECQRKEFFITKQSECVNNCTYIETGLRNGGKFDFTVVKKMLTDNTIKLDEWEKSLDAAVDNCEKLMKGNIFVNKVNLSHSIKFEFSDLENQKMNEQTVNIHLISCLTDELSNKCVEFRPDPICNKLKRFMKKCPEASPRKPQVIFVTATGGWSPKTYFNLLSTNLSINEGESFRWLFFCKLYAEWHYACHEAPKVKI